MPPNTKTKCLLCPAEVFSIPRHMRQVHNWNNEDSRSSLNILRLRKPKKSHKSKYCRKYYECPVESCNTVCKRIPQHLFQVHKIKRNDVQFISLFARTKEAEPPTFYVDKIRNTNQDIRSPQSGSRMHRIFTRNNSNTTGANQMHSIQVDSVENLEQPVHSVQSIAKETAEDDSTSMDRCGIIDEVRLVTKKFSNHCYNENYLNICPSSSFFQDLLFRHMFILFQCYYRYS